MGDAKIIKELLEEAKERRAYPGFAYQKEAGVARLQGFSVTKEGRLKFWCYPNAQVHIPEVKGEIPTDIILLGAEAVEQYVDREVDAAISKVMEERRRRHAEFEKVRVPVETLYGNVPLKGVLTSSIYGGQAVWDVSLTEPLGYEGRDTLYAVKYPFRARENEHLIDDVKPSNYALAQAQVLLKDIYKRRVHEKTHPLTYQVFFELKRREKEA